MRYVAAFAVIVVAVAGCGGSSTLSAKALKQQSDTAKSAAAEGALLADQVARERTTEPFARIHSGELAEQARSAAQSLSTAQAPAALESRRRQAAEAARATFAALQQLHESPSSVFVARRVERRLKALSR